MTPPNPEGLALLTDQERQAAQPRPGDFVESFIRWANLKTDAAPYILQAAALTALSLAAGDVVTVPGIFSDKPQYLNLYLVVVGPSTTTRKTTTLNLVRDVVPKNGNTGQDVVRFLDDVSIQALNQAAAEAGKTASPICLAVDEVASFFEASKSRGGYLKGIDKTLNRLYGHDPLSIARTGRGASHEVARGAFVSILGATTPDAFADVLEGGDVESGLLPRFIVIDATGTEPSPRITVAQRIANGARYAEEGATLKAHLARIAHDRIAGIPAGVDGDIVTFPTTTLEWSPEALDRIDALDVYVTEETARGTNGYGAILGRAIEHTTKLAGLYALSRAGKETAVGLVDVLRAIDLVSLTAADLLDLTTRLGENPHERNVKAVADLLDRQGRVTFAQISQDLKLDARDTQALRATVLGRRIAIDDEGDLIRPGQPSASERRLKKAADLVTSKAPEWVTSTAVDAALGKSGGVAEVLDDLVATGRFEDRTVTFPKSRSIRLRAEVAK